ncbi:MAG: DUF2163 domain-containing protein, partial [Alphaproteobacteria bacterium]
DHDRPLTVKDIACEPQTGLSASEATSALGLGVDSAEIEGALSSLGIAEGDVERGAFDEAAVETYLVNWAAPEQFLLLRAARIGTVTRSGGHFMAEMKSGAVDLDKIGGRRVTRRCDAQLGDSRCGYAGGAQTGTVTALVSDREIVAAGLKPMGGDWFRNGVLTFANGNSTVVLDHQPAGEGTRLRLRDLAIPPVAVGDTFRVLAGCDKSFAQCREKFDNGASFRGFPHLPGNDAAYTYADGKGNFDGGPLVP